ncbi:MAG: DUF2244 domain-containing protein [Pseudomarimonas sp.]
MIRPNRALSRRQIFVTFAVLAVASVLVAVISWTQGNAYAPAFAFAELSFLALCLRLVWTAGKRFEVVAVGPGEISVLHLPEMCDRFRAHPQWVRMLQRDGRVLLVSRGNEVEVGACLGEAERQSLAERLRNMMAAVATVRAAEPAGAP